MKKNSGVQYSQLLDMHDVRAVFEEVKYNFIQQYPIAAFGPVREAFGDFNLLYDGKYHGYHRCNTRYHDKIHTTDALLTLSRLIDGYNLSHPALPLRAVQIALIATIFHDTGYIQRSRDHTGTGAKYTQDHVERSVEFIEEYFSAKKYPRRDFITARNVVRSTGLFADLTKISFQSRPEKLLGCMLGTADILGQMASRTYLEKLMYLYKEFREAEITSYTSEFDLLKKTVDFYRKISRWLADEMENVQRFARPHFKKRYRISENLCEVAIDRHLAYLNVIIKCHPADYRNKLRRYSTGT